MFTGILPLVENVCCLKEGSATFIADCVVETSRLPIEKDACIFEEGSSTMDPNCAVEELSSSLLSFEPRSVTDKGPCKSLLASDILGIEALDSSGLIDEEGSDNVKFNAVPVVEFPDTSCSDPSGRSALTAKLIEKTLTRNTARERGKTVIEKPLLDSFLLRVARKRRSYLCKPARCSVWGSWGYITQVFEKNHGYDVFNQNGRKRSQKARGDRVGGKCNRNHSQSSRGKCCASSGHIRLKVMLGREVIQSCLADMVSNTNSSLRNYEGGSIEVIKSTEGSENKNNEEVPGINGYEQRNQDQEKVVMSSDATHLGLCIINKALDIPTINEESIEVNADNHQTLLSQVVVGNRYLDSGTSPDSEVINLIQEAQVNAKVQEDLYDVLSSSQACVALGDVTDLDVLQISSKKGKNKNRLPHEDDSSVEDRLPSPDIINTKIGLEIQGHGEKMGDVFDSSELSILTTVANVSSNTSSSDGFSREQLSSSKGTDNGVTFENFKVECGADDIYSRHHLGIIQSVDSNIGDKLHLHRKTKGQKHFKTSKSMRVSKTGSEASESPSSQKGNACKLKGNTVKPVSRRKGKDKGPCGEVTCKVESYPETGDWASADPEKVETVNESTTQNIVNLDMVPNCIGEQNLPPRSAWVCCDACLKWRRIPATLADAINETNGRWICRDNMDKGFADCSIPQEMSNAEINAELQLSDASCGEDGSDAHLNFNKLESKHSAVHLRSSWMLIKSNLFLHRTRKRQTIDEIMVCHCKPPHHGKMGCGDGCLNRMLNIECVQGTCPCGDLCSNQQFQKRKYANLNRVRCGKKGYGLETKEDIHEGRFLIEYVGEVLDMQAYEARQREYASMGHKHFYFMTLNGSEVIDACAKGNLGRFINHSCDPNCRTEKWMVNGEVCIGLFALREIKKGEELTFDYNYVRVFGAAAKECVCGSSQCRGYLGGDPHNTETIVKDDSDEEYPEPVMFYEDGEIDDNWKHLTLTASSFNTIEKVADHSLENKDKIGKSAIVGGHVERTRELQIAGIQEKEEDESGLSATAVHPLEISTGSSLIKSSSGAQLLNSLEVDNLVEGLLPLPQEEPHSRRDHNSNIPKSEAQKMFVQGLETSLQSLVCKPLADAINAKKFKSDAEDRHESKARTHFKTSRFPSSVKKGKLCSNSLKIDKSGAIVSKSNVLPNKSRKIMESSLNNRFEAVEEKLNELLDVDGGISKRKDATKGYLKLLFLTANSGDRGNGEAIQSNRDLSMILDALLKTRSRIVLVDIISKNGLQMLHNIMKWCRRNFNKIPILRKLLKVLEYLAAREILTSEHINGGPRCLGVESFRESILTLTEHDDKQVHQIARNFRDRWIPKPVRRSSGMDRNDGRVEFLRDSDCKRYSPSYIHGHDKTGDTEEAISSIKQSVIAPNSDNTGAPEGSSASGTSGFPTNGTRARKRKSRWDEPGEMISFDLISTQQKVAETQPSLLQKSHAFPKNEFGINGQDKVKVENRENYIGQNTDEDVPPGFSPDRMGQKIDEDVPPGFSVLSNASSVATDVHHENAMPSEFPFEFVIGHPNGRFNNRLATSYGIPLLVAQQFGIPLAETLESWIVAPGMPFQPFPPLPPYPRDKRASSQPFVPNQVIEKRGDPICHSDQHTTSTSDGARIPVDAHIHGAKNRHTFHQGNGTHSLARKYFKQKKWTPPQVGPPWIQKRKASGFMVNNSRNGMCSSVGVATVVNEDNGQSSSEYVNPGVQNSSLTFQQYPQQQKHH